MLKRFKKRLLCGALALSFLTGCSPEVKDTNSDVVQDQRQSNVTKHYFEDIIETNYKVDTTLEDEDEIEIPSDYKVYVSDALNKSVKDPIKVKDLKKITSLNIIPTEQDLSWINYCTSLTDLDITYAYKTDVTKYIKELPSLKKIIVDNVGSVVVDFDDLEFSFAKNVEYLNVRRNVDIDMDFLKTTNVKSLEVQSGAQNRINYKELDFLENIYVDPNDEYPYNTAIYFTSKDKEYLLSKGVNVVVSEKIDKINDQLDKINKSLEIQDSEIDLPKYRKIVTYVINHMYYGDMELEKNDDKYYVGGFLKGALDEEEDAICGNYAALVEALCLRNNIDAFIINSGQTGKHSWNLVKINKKYYYSDITNLDILRCVDKSTNEEISIEEFVDRYGLRDSVLPYFIFNTEDDDKMYSYTYLPREYKKYADEHATIYMAPSTEEQVKKLTLK